MSMDDNEKVRFVKRWLITPLLIFILLIFLSIVFVFIYFHFFEDNYEKKEYPLKYGITNFIEKECDFKSDTDSFILNINKIVPVKWDTMVIFYEDRAPEFLNNTIGFEYKRERISNGSYTYLFIKNEKIVYEEVFSGYVHEGKPPFWFFINYSNLSKDMYRDSLYVIKRVDQTDINIGKYNYELIPISNYNNSKVY